MAEVVRIDIEETLAHLSVTVTPADYEAELKTQLKEYKGKARVPGFRNGKVPHSFLLKRFGKPLLANIVNEKLQAALSNYLQAEQVNHFGQALLLEDHPTIDLDPRQQQDYTYIFEIGAIPDLELKSAEEMGSFKIAKLSALDQATIDEQFEETIKRKATNETVDLPIEEGDIIRFKVKEVKVAEAETVEGIESEFTVLYDRLSAALKEELLGQSKGYSTTFDIYKVEDNISDKHVRKYLLDLKEDNEVVFNNMFDAEVIEIKRRVLPTLDEAFFKETFGEEVTSEEEAKQFLAKQIQASYAQNADIITRQEVRKRLLEVNDFKISEQYIKRYLEANRPKEEAEITEEQYTEAVKDFKWTFIMNSLQKENQVEVTQQEVINNVASAFSAYGNFPPKQLQQLVQSMLSDTSEVNRNYQEVQFRKIFDILMEQVTLEEVAINEAQMKQLLGSSSIEMANELLEKMSRGESTEAVEEESPELITQEEETISEATVSEVVETTSEAVVPEENEISTKV